MRQPPPPDVTLGGIAPHIPSDTYRRAQATGQPVVIIQAAPAPAGRPARAYLIPTIVVITGALGIAGLVVVALALLDYALHTAATIAAATGPLSVGGITLKLASSKK
ncbi:hypothetical protein V7793_09645 [Streptomyces sp. KLMMK]|uniref:hypothetical protein n=1 Tax=Streptomyces sp. KLMMK TaxID=3109353 RepID=UPI003007FFD6